MRTNKINRVHDLQYEEACRVTRAVIEKIRHRNKALVKTIPSYQIQDEITYHFHFVANDWTEFLMDSDITSHRSHNNVLSGFCKGSRINAIQEKFKDYEVAFIPSDIYWNEDWMKKLSDL